MTGAPKLALAGAAAKLKVTVDGEGADLAGPPTTLATGGVRVTYTSASLFWETNHDLVSHPSTASLRQRAVVRYVTVAVQIFYLQGFCTLAEGYTAA